MASIRDPIYYCFSKGFRGQPSNGDVYRDEGGLDYGLPPALYGVGFCAFGGFEVNAVVRTALMRKQLPYSL